MTPNVDRESTPCPLCGAVALRRSFSLKGFALADCACCGLLYVRDRLREEAMMGFYGHDYFSNANELSHGYQDYDEMRREREVTFQRYLKRVLPHLERREQVLDIGCGYGYFLNAARPYFRNLAGTDVSADALQRVNPNFQVVCGQFSAGLFPAGFADLVMMCDVLEHLYHPVQFMSQVRQVMHPGGLVCLVTPNRRSLLSRLSGKRWVSFKLPEHVCYYDPDTIRLLLEKSGLRMIRCYACGQYATLDFVSKRLSHLLFKRQNVFPLPDFVRHRVLYVNSGSMLVLAGRQEEGV